MGQKDIYYDLVGHKIDRRIVTEGGIALNEVFFYEIDAKGHSLTVCISQDGKVIWQAVIEQSQSGYDTENEFVYFKAGTYNQNNTGHEDDYAHTTFYELKTEH